MTMIRHAALGIAAILLLAGCTPSSKPDPDVPPPPRSVYSIDAVSAVMTRKQPPSVVVKVRGIVNSGGWTKLELQPLQTLAPEGDVMSYTMIGTPPAPKAIVSQAFDWVNLELVIDPLPPGVKRIRILAATNQKTVELYP